MTAKEYLDELSSKRNEAGKDNSAQGEIRYHRLSRRWSLAFRATKDGVESADLLRGLTENLIHDWALPDGAVNTFKEAVNVVWKDAEDDGGDETEARYWSRRWSLVYTAINDGVRSVRQLQSLIENLSHQWTLPDNKVKTFKDAVNVEWHDAESVKCPSKQDEIMAKRLSRRWSLIHMAVNDGVRSVKDLQHLLLHLTHNWQLPDSKVKTFKEAANVEWHDAEDLHDSTAQQLSRRWSDIFSKTRKGCSSVKELQQDLHMSTTDDLDGSYDDYMVDATSLSGMSKKKTAVTTPSRQSVSATKTATPSPSRRQATPSPATTTQKNAMSLEEAEWYCVVEGQSFGPLNRPQFANMVRFGIVDANTLVWKSGMPQWALACTVAQLNCFI